MPAPLDWEVDGGDWPHRAHSRFVVAGGLRWHLQQWGPAGAPALLLLHGTGASTHSWRTLAPRLAQRWRVLAPDLPGHAFSETPAAGTLTLPGMARAVAALLQAEGVVPRVVVGHSAGAAIAVQMALDGALAGPLEDADGAPAGAGPAPAAATPSLSLSLSLSPPLPPPHPPPATVALVSLNGAFLPFGGVLAPLFSPLARLLYSLPAVSRLFARRAADPAVVRRLVEGTGSVLDDEGLALYGRLMRCPHHTRAALGLMAHWELRPLARALPRLALPLHLVVGAADRAVAPSQARRVCARVPTATLTLLPGLGHLAHEQDAGAVLQALQPVLGAAAAAVVAEETLGRPGCP